MNTGANGVIYMLTSPSGKSYIGQTWNYENRMARYRRGANKGQTAIYNAVAKYGWKNTDHEILESGVKTQEELDAREEYWIAALNTLAPNGYNLKTGGGGGGSPCAETRAKISASTRGKVVSDATRAKISAKGEGRKHTAETRAKMSKSRRGKNNHWFGKTHSPETRAKMSASHAGKKMSPEAIAKSAAASRGRKHTPEARAKMSAKKRGKNNYWFGKTHSPETRAKMSASAKARRRRDAGQTELDFL